jgi:hypothetical protein
MLKRVTFTFAELALWLVGLALLTSGCARPATAEKQEQTAAKPVATNGEESAQTSNGVTELSKIPLIPREVLFGNPERAQARLSSDGKWISFQAPLDGVMNVWVAPADDLERAKAVTKEKVRPVPSHSWAYDSKHILYIQDKNGDENFHLYATNVETGETRDLTPIDGVRAEIQEVSHKSPNEILVGLNDRDKRYHDIWRVNIQTGEKQLVQQNPGVAGYLTDDDYTVRLLMNYTPTGGQIWQVPEGEGDQMKWKDLLEIGPEDSMTSGPAGFDKTAR